MRAINQSRKNEDPNNLQCGTRKRYKDIYYKHLWVQKDGEVFNQAEGPLMIDVHQILHLRTVSWFPQKSSKRSFRLQTQNHSTLVSSE